MREIIPGTRLVPGQFGVLTLHRPATVDSMEVFRPLLGALLVANIVDNHYKFDLAGWPRSHAGSDGIVTAPPSAAVATAGSLSGDK